MKNTKLIREAYSKLSEVFYSHNQNYAEQCFKASLKEEKEHRGFGPDFALYHPNASSARDMAKMFTVKRVAEYITSKKFPSGKDYLHTQKSCFIAAGIADEFTNEVVKAWQGLNWIELRGFDYCDFVKAQTPKTTA